MYHHRSRRPYRHRPVPPPPSRAQVRQRISWLSALYKLEALVELEKPGPDCVHLTRLEKDAGLLNQALSYLEEVE